MTVDESNAYTYNVLVPGCGLARLPVEIVAEGYNCQGNEFSAFMALPNQFMLNAVNKANCYDINPWLDRGDISFLTRSLTHSLTYSLTCSM